MRQRFCAEKPRMAESYVPISRVQHRMHPKDRRYARAKYSKIREDGTLEVPNPYTLKWVLPHYYRLSEKQATMAMWAVTAVFCVLGFFVPG
jgi:hypothetical protein